MSVTQTDLDNLAAGLTAAASQVTTIQTSITQLQGVLGAMSIDVPVPAPAQAPAPAPTPAPAPAPAPAPTATLSIGTGAKTVLLAVSQDIWGDPAQYTVAVDNVQIGGTLSATAEQSKGVSDSVSVLGDWAAGAHTLSVTFLNDGWGGTADTDRNLYVDKVVYDSVVVGSPAELAQNGTLNFTFTVVAAAPAPAPAPSGVAPTAQGPLDLPSTALPFPSSMAGKGYGCIADYTFGSTAGTLKSYADIDTYFYDMRIGGDGKPTVDRLNDEWQYAPPADKRNGITLELFSNYVALRCVSDARIDPNHPAWFADALAQAAAVGAFYPTQNTAIGRGWDQGVRGTSLTAKRLQKGGYVEVCYKGPNKRGFWGGPWFIDGSGQWVGHEWPPEIDLNEIANNGLNSTNTWSDSTNNMGLRFHPAAGKTEVELDPKDPNYNAAGGGYLALGFDWALDFHVLGMEWVPGTDPRGDRFTFYVDQKMVWDGYFPWVNSDGTTFYPSGPAAFILQAAYGGEWPGRGGGMVTDGLPVEMQVKYLRMFSK